jgi:class 3 adenylate cyclase
LEAHRVERKLSAIFAADVEGYSRLMGQDEVGTLRTLTAYRAIIDPLIASHRGRIFNTAGDSLVADFASAVDAVQCAVAVQEAVGKANSDRPADEQMRFRIGIHVGDIIVQGDNLFGDAVNIAARLEAVAQPGGICVSGTVQDQIGTKLPLSFTDLGEQQVKNIAQPIKAYRIRGETSPTGIPIVGPSLPLPDKPAHFLKHQFGDAAAILLASLEQAPGLPVAYQLLAACYAHMGRLDAARETLEQLRAITPVVVPRIVPYRNPEDRELFLSGLRLAAGETA